MLFSRLSSVVPARSSDEGLHRLKLPSCVCAFLSADFTLSIPLPFELTGAALSQQLGSGNLAMEPAVRDLSGPDDGSPA